MNIETPPGDKMLRNCRVCGPQPITEFWKGQAKDGLQYECKSCRKKLVNAWRAKNRKEPKRPGPKNPFRGEQCHTAKLEASDIPLIRYELKDMSSATVAAKFDVTPACIRAVRNYATWTHIR